MCNLRIRQLFILGFEILSLITMILIGWNAIQVSNQYDDVEELAGSNAIAHPVLELSALLARERGFTGSLLTKSDNQIDMIRQCLLQAMDDSSMM